MNYMKQVDEWLTGLFEELLPVLPEENELRFRKAIKDKVLESFRNGQKACPKCNPKPPKRVTPTASPQA